jgi:hypothetical protein
MRSSSTPGALPGLFPLAALTLTVAVAYSTYAWLPSLGWLIPTTAGAASVLLVIDLPNALNHSKAVPINLWARLPVAVLLAILFAKLLLLHRHATREYAHRPPRTSSPPLLPSQQEYLDEIRNLVIDRGSDRVLPLEGRQGEGKSFLIQRLKDIWDGRQGTPAVVIVDVWRQQKESDLQAAILEALFSHRAYLARLGWLQVPASFLLARWISALREATSNLEFGLKSSKAKLELKLDIPGIRWQTHFERITTRRAWRGGDTVVVLDELDRATPAVTQAALTLARRSVGVRGVTVVIPYIRSHIRYKAFNPLQPALPDLQSSMDAILYEERFSSRSGNDQYNSPDTILDFWESLRRKFWENQEEILAAVDVNSQNQSTVLDDARDRSTDNAGRRDLSAARMAGFLGRPPDGEQALAMALRFGVFADVSAPARERLQGRFEEKYLSAEGLTLRSPDPRDVAAMVTTHFHTLVRKVGQLLPQPSTSIGPAVQRGLENWLNRNPKLTGPPIRALAGAINRNLEEALSMARNRGVLLSPQDIATLIVAAYDAAGLVY